MPQRRVLLASALAGLAVPSVARAQAWPARPIRLLLPDTPGSGNDSTARIFSHFLEQGLGQPVAVDNRGGAGGRIGVEAAFRSPGDGYTWLLGNAGSNGINAALYRDLPYDLETSFIPVSLLVTGPNLLAVNPRVLPVNSVQELIAYVRARPGQINYASAGPGSSAHFSMELFKSVAGLDLVHIPYRGAPAMAQAAVQGDAPVLVGNLVNVMGFIQRGELKPLAVTSLTRSVDLPQVPTLDESGLRGFETLAWNAMFAPPGTPAPIVARMLAELQRVAAIPDVRMRLRALGGDLVASAPEVLAARVRADIARWKDLAQRANIRIDG
ncbi:MAG: tripartite tricarboxylate transporter substrate binding protein [Roseomonas sp.]|nr:tripartite tricarboxylate transporter substrate binding protein [Roseomonas sp.]